jgi:hypothetical protein
MVETAGEKPTLGWNDLSANEVWDLAIVANDMHDAYEATATAWLAGQALARGKKQSHEELYSQLPATLIALMPENMVVNEQTKTWLGQQMDGVRQQGKKITQRMVADQLGVTTGYISRVLSRQRVLSLDSFADACDLFANLLIPEEVRDHFVQGHIIAETARRQRVDSPAKLDQK